MLFDLPVSNTMFIDDYYLWNFNQELQNNHNYLAYNHKSHTYQFTVVSHISLSACTRVIGSMLMTSTSIDVYCYCDYTVEC